MWSDRIIFYWGGFKKWMLSPLLNKTPCLSVGTVSHKTPVVFSCAAGSRRGEVGKTGRSTLPAHHLPVSISLRLNEGMGKVEFNWNSNNAVAVSLLEACLKNIIDIFWWLLSFLMNNLRICLIKCGRPLLVPPSSQTQAPVSTLTDDLGTFVTFFWISLHFHIELPLCIITRVSFFFGSLTIRFVWKWRLRWNEKIEMST